MKACVCILIVIWTTTSQVFGQNKAIDSLLLALNNEKNQQKRSDILHELASLTWDFDFEKGRTYAEEALRIAKSEGYELGQAQALTDMGLYFYFKGDYANALDQYKKSLGLLNGNVYDRYPSYTIVRIANLYRVQAQFDSAKVYYQKAEAVLDQKDNNFSRSSLYQNLGIFNNDQSRFYDAIRYFKKAIAIRSLLGDSSLIAEGYNGLGQSYKGLSKLDSAIVYYDKAFAIAQLTHNVEFEMFYYINRGEVHFLKGEYSKAINSFSKGLEILKQHDFQRYYVIALKNIGQVLDARAEYAKAFDHYQRAMRMAEKLKSRQEIAQLNGSLGWLYIHQRIDSLAITYAQRALNQFETIHDKTGIAFANNLLGFIFYSKRDYERSLAYYQKALELRREIGSQRLISATLFNIARVYERQGLYQKALAVQLKSAEYDLSESNLEGLTFSYNSLGTLYMKLGDYGSAESYLIKAHNIASEISRPLQKLESYKYLGNLYKIRGNFSKALQYSEKYIALNDSIFSMESVAKIAEMNSLYDLQTKEQEILLLSQQNEIKQNQIQIQQSQITLQNFFLIASIVGLMLLSILAYFLYQYYKSKSEANVQLMNLNKEIQEKKEEIEAQSEELLETNESLRTLNQVLIEKSEEIQAQSEELTEANAIISSSNRNLELQVDERTSALKQAYKELDTFFYRSSHDFRRPLTTLMGLAEVAKITLKDTAAVELFSKVNETAIGVDRMLFKLQSVSTIASTDLIYGEIDFNRKIDAICELLHASIMDKRIRIERHINLSRPFFSYSAILEIIIQNLVENAVQYTRAEPHVNIRVSNDQKFLKMEVEDNGEGIADEFQNRIFEMYFRANERSKGNGLGLYIVKKAVEKLSGEVSFTSRPGAGTTFFVTLPIDHRVS